MKKKYDPIRVPVCRCGHQADVTNRLREHMPPFTVFALSMNEDGRIVGFTPKIKKNPNWLCGCVECEIVAGGSTKRMAMQAFEKAVEIHVDA